MSIPFYCPQGHVFTYDGQPLTFVENMGAGFLHFRRADGTMFQLPSTDGSMQTMPNVVWALQAFRAGRLSDPNADASMLEGRQDRFLNLDRSACLERDPLSVWRFDWADAATAARIRRSKQGVADWLKISKVPGKRPKWRSLLRWMERLRKGGGRIGALVNASGRLKGESQLTDLEDRLVHKWAIAYWRPSSLHGFLPHKEDAAAKMTAEWDRLDAAGVHELGDDAPSAETMRERINSLECYSMHASRYGRPSADARYKPAGEPVPVERPFERIYMDGTEYEHSVFHSGEVKIPVGKMRGVMAMCCFSLYVFPFKAFVGPYRPEMGLAALRNVMVPPEMTAEEVAEDPEGSQICGIPSDVMIDRDRTLVPPRAVPGVITIVSTFELAEAYHSDAKSELESFHDYVKAAVRELVKGQILGARSKYDIGYDPLAETNVTRAQYADLIEECRRQWNDLPKTCRDDRSPIDIMRTFVRSGQARLTDPGEVRRALSSTPSKKGVLTTNGLTYDNIHYRFNRDGVGAALSMNHHSTPFGKRLKRDAKILVTMRVWDDDLDYIEIYDEHAGTYHGLYSTEPEYTGGLTRWEHHQYQKLLRKGGGGATTRRDGLRRRAKHLDAKHRILKDVPFRERGVPAALMAAEEERLSGARARRPGYAETPELHIPTGVGGADRVDAPKPPPQDRVERSADPDAAGQDSEAEFDVRSDPSAEIARELGDDRPEAADSPGRWDFDDDDGNDDDHEED